MKERRGVAGIAVDGGVVGADGVQRHEEDVGPSFRRRRLRARGCRDTIAAASTAQRQQRRSQEQGPPTLGTGLRHMDLLPPVTET